MMGNHGDDDKGNEEKSLMEKPYLRTNSIRSLSLKVLKRPDHCSDRICIMFILLLILGILFVTFYSHISGLIPLLKYSIDSYGQICGVDNRPLNHSIKFEEASKNFSKQDLREKEYLMYLNSKNAEHSRSICVRKCNSEAILTRTQFMQATKKYGDHFCRYDVQPEPTQDIFSGTICPVLPMLRTVPVAHRCVPDIEFYVNLLRKMRVEAMEHSKNQQEMLSKDVTQSNEMILPKKQQFVTETNVTMIDKDIETLLRIENSQLNQTNVEKQLFRRIASDIYRNYYWLFLIVIISIVFSSLILLALYFVRSISLVIIYSLAIFVCFVNCCTFWSFYIMKRINLNKRVNGGFNLLETEIDAESTLLIFAISATLFLIFIILFCYILYVNVKMTEELYSIVNQVLRRLPHLYWQPLFIICILIIFVGFWLYIFMLLSTVGKFEINNFKLIFDMMDSAQVLIILYHFFVLIILCCVILAAEEMMVSGTVVLWYFTRTRRDRFVHYCLESWRRLFSKYFISLWISSLLFNFIKPFRTVFLIVQQKCLYGILGAENCLRQECWKSCFQFFYYLSSHAYPTLYIYGANNGIIECAKRSFTMLTINPMNFLFMDIVVTMSIFALKVFVSGISTFVMLIIIYFYDDDRLQTYSITIPLTILISYLVAHSIIGIYEMVNQSLLTAITEDWYETDTELFLYNRSDSSKMDKKRLETYQHISIDEYMRNIKKRLINLSFKNEIEREVPFFQQVAQSVEKL
ncbi:hypothetical protein SNEBB_005862 [Seison nebaliae]|nr:hypothetical protein SNEBB_005862 [Seison nebaliae]